MRWLPLLLLLHTLYAETIDVAIIGGGITGTYAGYKLVENGKSDVQLFEGSERIGGRLYTTFLPDMPNVPVELGVMHFFPSQKKSVKLIDQLGLQTLPVSGKRENNFVYLRGKRFRELEMPKDLPYDLLPEERNKTPIELIIYAMRKIDPKLSVDNFSKMKEKVMWKGKSLHEISFQSFLLEELSAEAFQLLVDLDYIQMVADVSLAYGLSRLLEAPSGEPMKLTKGFDQLPKELAKRFVASGGKLHMKHHLLSVSYEGERENFRYRLLFFQEDGSFKQLFAKHLILTISPPALKLLAQQSPALQADLFQDNLDQLVADPTTKLYLGYRYPWWQKLGLFGGSSVSSLPMNRCFYFESEEEMPGGQKGNRNALILASFQNLFTDFWESFNEGEEFAPHLGEHGRWQAEKQLEILHGVRKMPKAYTGIFHDWSDAPHFGFRFFWKTGSRPEELARYFQHPFVAESLYVIGPAYSERQGWIESGLDAVDQLLKAYFFID